MNINNSYGPQLSNEPPEEPKKKRTEKKRGVAGYFFSGLSGVLSWCIARMVFNTIRCDQSTIEAMKRINAN